jgi:hypothetical protein
VTVTLPLPHTANSKHGGGAMCEVCARRHVSDGKLMLAIDRAVAQAVAAVPPPRPGFQHKSESCGDLW